MTEELPKLDEQSDTTQSDTIQPGAHPGYAGHTGTETELVMHAAVELARNTMRQGLGGPFGAAIVKDGTVIAYASNSVLGDHDPTAHAEVNAIRQAGKILGTHNLQGCELYATGYPCPMCLSAIIWANIKTVHYGCTPQEAEAIGFRDDFIYRFINAGMHDQHVLELKQTNHEACLALFREYQAMGKTIY